MIEGKFPPLVDCSPHSFTEGTVLPSGRNSGLGGLLSTVDEVDVAAGADVVVVTDAEDVVAVAAATVVVAAQT